MWGWGRKQPEERPPETVDLPPFPPLTWEEGAWTGRDVLPSWRGFQDRSGPYTSAASDEPSAGTVMVNVTTPYGEPAPPSAEQAAAYGFLKENEASVAAAVLQAIFDEYQRVKEEGMPPVQAPADLRGMIGMGIVHVHPEARDGLAYIGFELGCTWEEEHGLGVMTHRDRVLQVGDAETGFGWTFDPDSL